MEMEDLLQDENQEMTLELTHAVRLFCEAESFVTCRNALSEDGTLPNLFLRKSGLRLSLAHSNPLLPTSDILQENGKKIALKKDFLAFHLPAF